MLFNNDKLGIKVRRRLSPYDIRKNLNNANRTQNNRRRSLSPGQRILNNSNNPINLSKVTKKTLPKLTTKKKEYLIPKNAYCLIDENGVLTTEHFITKEDLKATFLFFDSPKKLPVFVLDKEDFKNSLYHWAGFDDINFLEHPDFSKRFHLSGNKKTAIRKLFT